jgi:hypothetical protein
MRWTFSLLLVGGALWLMGGTCGGGSVVPCMEDADCVETCTSNCERQGEELASAFCAANSACQCGCVTGGTGGAGGGAGAGGSGGSGGS